MISHLASPLRNLVSTLILFISISPIHAQSHLSSTPSSITQYRVEVTTEFPIHLGLSALLELNHGLRLQSSIGWMPSHYVQVTNDIVQQIIPDAYPPETAKLVEDTIRNSLVWTIKGGWRPFENSGFYINLGYTLAALGGGSTAKGLIEGITGVSTEDRSYNTASNYRERKELPIDAAASLHFAAFDLGWEWSLVKYKSKQELILRTALGFSYTFTSSAKLTAQSDDPRPRYQEALRRLESAGEDYLVETFGSYIHPPSFTIALGYTF